MTPGPIYNPLMRRALFLGLAGLAALGALAVAVFAPPPPPPLAQVQPRSLGDISLTTTGGSTTYLPLVLNPPPDVRPDWLKQVAYYRLLTRPINSVVGLSAPTEETAWSVAAQRHALYVVNEAVPAERWHLNPSDYAAEVQAYNSLLLAQTAPPTLAPAQVIDLWMRSPFQALHLIDPQWTRTGWGYRTDPATPPWQMVAVLNVRQGVGDTPPNVTFPLAFPGPWTTVPARAYAGTDTPNPRRHAGCENANGLPIILQLGPGNQPPANVSTAVRVAGGAVLSHCAFHEGTFADAQDPAMTTLGRNLLAARSAIVIMPLAALTAGSTYEVDVSANGGRYVWTFTVAAGTP